MTGPESSEWRGLRADLGRRIGLCSRDELRMLDELLVGIERIREYMAVAPSIHTVLRVLRARVAEIDRIRACDDLANHLDEIPDLGGEG